MVHTFHIVPARSVAFWLFVVPVVPVVIAAVAVEGATLPMLLIGVAVSALIGKTLAGSRGARFEVSPEGLRLRGDLYGRRIPRAALRAAQARVVDLRADRELRLQWRMLGTLVPGYAAGWFKLRGGERALVYATDRSRAVYVPTTLGYSLLLTPERPEEFVARLREVAG